MSPQSYACGSINTIGWITLTASVVVIPPQIILGIVKLFNRAFEIKRWQGFLIYQALNLLSLLYNALVLPRLPGTHTVGCKQGPFWLSPRAANVAPECRREHLLRPGLIILSIGSFVATTIACLVVAHPNSLATSSGPILRMRLAGLCPELLF